MTPHDERFFHTPLPIVSDIRLIGEYALAHCRCAATWLPQELAIWETRFGLSTHHIVKRSVRRNDSHWNLIRLSDVAHRAAEGEQVILDGPGRIVVPKLTMGMVLKLKSEEDPDQWDPDLLRQLYGRRLPDFEDLPDWYLRERQRRHPIPSIKELHDGP